MDVSGEVLARSDPFLVWTGEVLDARVLRRAGIVVYDFASVRRDFVVPALGVGATRRSLENPAQGLLDVFERCARVAVLGVPTRRVTDLRVAYGMLVEPAFRRDCTLIVGADRELGELEGARFVERDLGYAATLEKLRFLAERWELRLEAHGEPPLTPIEAILMAALRERGLRPVPQFGISRMRVDFAFPQDGLVVEADGRDWHDRVRDERRDARLRELGWGVLRISGRDIVRDASGCAARVERELLALRADQTRLSPALDDRLALRRSWWRWLLARIRFGRHSRDAGRESLRLPRVRVGGPELDEQQELAATARDGVVQVIAPAGSGKTTVLIERVRELRARGIPAERILCATFNQKAVEEIKLRLAKSAAGAVEVRTFHALGLLIGSHERLGRGGDKVGGLSALQWARVAAQAAESVGREGVRLDPVEAREAVSDVKLATLMTWEELAELCREGTGFERTVAALYELYEREQDRARRNDFDDMLLLAVRHLRQNVVARERWQRRWQCLLVDEYQDIEPAQELLIRLLAAPEDSLFCVGDEDQTLYAWRRASVERIVELDQRYPGLQRIALAHNYRCPPEIVDRSRTLIEHNTRRFPKQIRPAPASDHEVHRRPIGGRRARRDAAGETTLEAVAFPNAEAAAHVVASRLVDRTRGEIVVLARSTRLLRDVAVACARRDIHIDARDEALGEGGAIGALAGYLRLFSDPSGARREDIATVFRAPNRYLPERDAPRIAAALRTGQSFTEAIGAGRYSEDWRRRALLRGATFFDTLAGETSASRLIHALRTRGGLDRYYSDIDKLTATDDQVNLDDLAAAEAMAAGKTLADFVAEHQTRQASLKAIRDTKDGIELATIHAAKGRQWQTVVLFAADDNHLPSHRALHEPARQRVRVAADQRTIDRHRRSAASASADALEDERRLAYVAFTRARTHLYIAVTGTPSRFLDEAGIDVQPPFG